MRGKLHNRLNDIETELRRLARAAELHPTAAHVKDLTDQVKAAREDVAGMAEATQTSLKAVGQNLAGVLAKAAELAGTPTPAPAAVPAARKAAPAKATDPSTSGKEDK